MEIVWKNEQEIAKVRASYSTFTRAFNEAIDRLEKRFKVVLREDDVELFFENRKCVTPFVEALANYLWNYGSKRLGTSQDELETQIKGELSPFVRTTLSLYWTAPDYVEIVDCRLRVLEDKLDAYLMEQHSVSLNTENRKKVWELAVKACEELNELENLSVESSNSWFKTHATTANMTDGRAIIKFHDGRYCADGSELSNIK
jgi:hypothetical protein